MNFKLFVSLDHYVTQRAFGVVLSDKVDVIFLLVVNNLVQPDDVGVFKPLENLQLFQNTVIGCLAIASLLFLKLSLVHLFNCVLDTSL